jgi:hypothetical protein
MDAKIALRRHMKRFWMFVYWAHYHGNAGLSGHCTASRISKPSLEAQPSEEEPSREGPRTFVPDGLLAAKLALTLESFELDCFHWNEFTFVSEKMRSAMALGPSDIQYFDVDASESAPLPRSKNYRTMHVPVTEDVADLENSDYICRHRPDGSVVQAGMPLSLAFRRDAEPTHEIFYEKHFNVIYCTDEFAVRVLQAGCSGAFFFDPSRPFGGEIRLRTLRGVEEIVKWTKKLFRTKLIRPIP